MRQTPPRTPPTTGARGNFLPVLLFCTKAGGEDGSLDRVDVLVEGEEIRFVVLVEVSDMVENWGTKG